MDTGFSSPDTIDLITHDAIHDEFALIIVHSGEWDASADEEALLQKLNSYLHFVLDGEFERRYPQATGKRLRLQSDSIPAPPDSIREIIAQANEQLAPRNIRVVLNLLK